MDNVISETIDPTAIKLKGKVEPITICKEPPYKRTMQRLKKPEDILCDVLEAIKIAFSECYHIVVKLLKSEQGDTQQISHTDYVPQFNSLRSLSHFHYSAIMNIEENTKLIVGESEVVKIPLHSMLFFRGDMVHAGAEYEFCNTRLFFSASSDSFPATDDVFNSFLMHTYILLQNFD